MLQMQVNWLLNPNLSVLCLPERATQSMPSMQTNKSLEEWLPSVLKGRGQFPAPEMALLDDWGSPGILVVPPNEMSISIEDSWVVLDLAGKKVDFLIDMETTYFVLISHAGPLLHKLYCDSYQWKASHPLFRWCSHLPIQAAVNLLCVSNWASVSYSSP